MDNKINLSQLADLLAKAGGMSKAASEQFVKNFFEIISQNVLTDGLVKVKGLGTFKLVQMEDRESVNVNSGERFTIEGHQKISFVPDADLKERINKPFAAFETVEITEEQATQLDKMDQELADKTDTDDVDTDNTLTTKITDTMEQGNENEMELNENGMGLNENEMNLDQNEMGMGLEENEMGMMPDEEEPKGSQKESKQEPKNEPKEKKNNVGIKVLIWVLSGILVLALIIFLLWPIIGGKALKKADKKAKEKAPITTVIKSDTVKAAPKPKAEAKFTLTKEDQAKALPLFGVADTVNYKIVGTLTVHTMEKGDMLTTIALKYYGTKKLWPYIAKYNGLKSRQFKKMPVGYKVKVPKLANK